MVLVGCKLDMRTDLATLRELSKQRLIPVTHEQVSPITCNLIPALTSHPGRVLVSDLKPSYIPHPFALTPDPNP